jgi:hypothetical protein
VGLIVENLLTVKPPRDGCRVILAADCVVKLEHPSRILGCLE